jgi:hypothetical protein
VLRACRSIAACGRKNPPVPPEGEESRYTFPSFYPSRRSGTPMFGRDLPEPAKLAEPAPGSADEPDAEERPRRTFGEGPAVRPFNRGYTEPGPYGTSSQ